MSARLFAGRSGTVKTTAFVGASALAVTGAVLYPGFQTADVDLNDGGVWVVNAQENKVAHLNYQSGTLDGGVTTTMTEYDLAQHGSQVYLRNLEQAALTTVDPAAFELTDENMLPTNGSFSFGESMVAVSDTGQGRVYAAESSALGSLAAEGAEPIFEGEGRVISAVGRDDSVWVADLDGNRILGFRPLTDEERQQEGTEQVGDGGSPDDGSSPEQDGSASGEDGSEDPAGFRQIADTEVDGLQGLTEPQITAVGDTAVVFDPASGTVVTSEGNSSAVVDPAEGRLQAPGPDADSAVISLANKNALVPLGGGEPQYAPVESTGTPVQPVRVGSCTHSAWTGSGTYLRDCDDDSQDTTEQIPELPAEAQLVFRVNRDVVVLNDINEGNTWLVQDAMKIVNNWADLEPPKGEGEQEEEESDEVTDAIELPDRQEENQKPIARDDSFGVRAGRTTALPVLFNDVDPDGDLLTATLRGDQPELGTVQPIYDGTGFQIVVPDDATGRASFTYRADDGRTGTDDARVNLRVVPEDENTPPKQERVTTLRVQAGTEVSQNILTDWRDPDGDDLQLLGATSEDGDVVRVRPDGVLTFEDVGKTTGMKELEVSVSDRRESTTGRVMVEVLPRGSAPPVTATDHVTVNVGEEAQFSPLTNDFDPTGTSLRLAHVDQPNDADVSLNADTGTVTFRGDQEKTHYLKYVATNGPASAPGLVRVDVKDPEKNTGAPVAVRDVALLPANEDVLVNVLGNDSDPAGGVLVVQQVSLPEESPVTVAVERNALIRVTDQQGLREPLTFTYTVTNGSATSVGEVTVIPIPAPEKLEPPRPNPDTAVVRAGDVVTVPVLENDVHPNGAELTLEPELAETVDAEDGLISVADDTIRFRAGQEAKTVSAVYTVSGPDGQEASARVTFHIQPEDLENNSPPAPERVEARVFAGNTVAVPIPLNGIDPDGDSVSLVQLETPPTQGTAKVTADSIEYSASEGSSGTDSFSYVVEDRLGARAVGTIQVGIAPVSSRNTPPVAVNDSIRVRPDRPVAVDVLSNDTDADGDELSFVDWLEASEGSDAALVDGRILLTAPAEPGFVSVTYKITDGRGGQDTATLTVESDPEAPLRAPIARDDRVSFQETVDRDEVTVEILKNDEDPDGTVEDLQVSLPDAPDGVELTDDRQLVVPVTSNPQVITYQLTDVDDLRTYGFVVVPGAGEARPALASDTPLEIMAGETLTMALSDLVVVRDGRSPRITDESRVTSSPQSQGSLVGSATELTFTSADDYAGAASVTFEVTDGSGPDDPEGLKSVLTQPIRVLPRPEENKPPTLQSNTLEVSAGGDPARLDLRQAANDPDPGDNELLEFALGEQELEGVSASLEGSILTVQADADTPKGSRGNLPVSVTDGKSDPVNAQVTVTVNASDRPLTIANPDTVAEARQGEPVTVDVLANDRNFFEDVGPLRLLAADMAEGQGVAEVSGSSLVITPGEDYVGQMRVQYTVGDASMDPARDVTGMVTLNVKGRPDAPGVPRVESVSDGQVVLTWDAPANNGSPITGYTVKASGVNQACPATTCTISGLTNNTEYTFTVTATNDVGESEPSAASAPARPDVEPEQPAPPRGTDGDRKVDLTWTPPVNRGSPITAYTVEISPAPPNGITQRQTGGTSLSWDGLVNGTAYQFRVQAVNDADRPSEFSGWSSSVTPAGKPMRPLAPSASRAESAVNGGVANVSWTVPNANGATITGYDLQVFEGGTLVRTIRGISGTSQQVTDLKTTSAYSFAVIATNRVGSSEASARSTAVTPYGRPKAPGTPKLTATGRNNELTVDFTAGSANGSPITGYQYSVSGGSWQAFPGGSGASVNVGGNGTNVTVRVRAINAAGAGDPSAVSNQDSAYGPLRDAANVRATGGKEKVDFSWNSSADAYANGRPVTLSVSVNGSSTPNDGSQSVKVGHDTQRTITVTAKDSAGQTRSWTASATSDPAPPPPTPPSVRISRGAPIDRPGQCSGDLGCSVINATVQNMDPGTYTVECWYHNSWRYPNQDYRFSTANSIRVGSNGSFSGSTGCMIEGDYVDRLWVVINGVKSNEIRSPW
ncbi:Ig-like domain-containing protein [Micrococcus terreus]|uniref:Fibronectin type III domain-containing protein n=1 Tax=Micrococcus terreus TaxID=574650 RepID=A0A1I7MP31_9MICC|nr:Ig-like domain-containing protein [Micrococcus terreus]SFV23676.1 Fibronectin type III domain-containing protein [Micrococcus terreus]